MRRRRGYRRPSYSWVVLLLLILFFFGFKVSAHYSGLQNQTKELQQRIEELSREKDQLLREKYKLSSRVTQLENLLYIVGGRQTLKKYDANPKPEKKEKVYGPITMPKARKEGIGKAILRDFWNALGNNGGKAKTYNSPAGIGVGI